MTVTDTISGLVTSLQGELETAITDMVTWRPTGFAPATPTAYTPGAIAEFDGSGLIDRINEAADNLDVTIDADLSAVPEFTAAAPADLSIPDLPYTDNPLAGFDGAAFNSPQYQSALMSMLEEELRRDISEGRLGIPADVEEQIWNREAERDLLAVNRSLTLADSTFARRGFGLPPGKLDAKRKEILNDYTNTQLTRSREIAEKQADLTQKNRETAIQGLIEIQKAQMDFALRYGGFLLSIAKETVDAMLLIYNARIARYTAGLQGFSIEAQVYRDRVQAYVARFSALVEKAKAQGVLGGQVLDAKVKGVLAAVEVEKLNTNVAVENARTAAEAYRVTESALTSRIQILAEQIKAENQIHLDAQATAGKLIEGLMTSLSTSDANIKVTKVTSGV